MAEITASLVKELREKTGAGMMDCKKALTETGGDLTEAQDWLRKKGLSTAAKKAGRVAAEGLVGVVVEGMKGAMVEVNAETDFVARNEQFQAFVAAVARIALDSDGDVDRVKGAAYPGTGRSVEEELTHLVATVGENMTLRRAAAVSVGRGAVASYVHNQVADGLGRIGVLVGVETEGDAAKAAAFGRQLAMHVAAASPQALSPDDVDPGLIERERRILTEQARASGKPDDIVARMVEGRIRKFYDEVALMEQIFVIDGESKVKQAVEAAAKEIGAPLAVTAFVRFGLGEGIEKKESDFAADVAATAAG